MIQNLVRIQTAKVDDLDQLVKIEEKVFGENYETWKEEKFLRYIKNRNAMCLVARNNGYVIGKAIGVVHNRPGARSVSIEDLSVLPMCRCCGLGTRLIRTIERRARKAGCVHSALYVDPGNERVMGLYNRLGYSKARSYDYYGLIRLKKDL